MDNITRGRTLVVNGYFIVLVFITTILLAVSKNSNGWLTAAFCMFIWLTINLYVASIYSSAKDTHVNTIIKIMAFVCILPLSTIIYFILIIWDLFDKKGGDDYYD